MKSMIKQKDPVAVVREIKRRNKWIFDELEKY